MRILVVEDEPKVAMFIRQGLEEQGFEVDLAYDGFTGEKLALSRLYDIMIIDIIIPMVNGIELCRKLKAERPQVPVMMLTALGTTDDKVAGFNAGADDYLVKPFEFKELLVRIRSLTKRFQMNMSSTASNLLRVGDLELNLDRKTATRGGRVIKLTAKEFALLEYLMRNHGKVVSRVDISEKVWDIRFDTGTNVVEVYVNILRKKIDKDFDKKLLQTRIGLGYVLVND